MSLHSRTALVTGGAGSLGQAISQCLKEHGCRVVVLDANAAGLATFVAATGVEGITCDLNDADATERCVRDAWERFGPISILVNAAGLIHSAPLIDVTTTAERRHDVDAWRRVIDANLTSVFLATVNTVERMVSTRTRGVVISFSSVAAIGNAGQGAYSAAKAGVNALTRAWAKELGALGIRFVAIAPGFIDTRSTRDALSEPILKELVRRTPLRRLGSIEDIVSAVLFAITNEHLTGKVIELDGGLTM